MRVFFTILFSVAFLICHAQKPTIEWEKSFGGSDYDGSNDYDGGADFICPTSDGGSIVEGHTYSTDGQVSGNHGGGDIWVVKLNSKGDLIWQKCLGGSEGEYAKAIKQTYDGGYIIVGSTSTPNDGDVTGNHGIEDAWVVKLDSIGNITWQRCYGGSYGDNGLSIEQTTDSGYIVACATQSYDGDITGEFHGFSDIWVLKLDKSGAIKWQKLLGGKDYDYPLEIEETFDKGCIISGITSSNDGDVSGNHGGAYDGWIVKLDSVGTLEWQKCLGGSLWDEARSVKQTSDSGYIVACMTKSHDGDAASNHGINNYLIIKLDKTGNTTWEKCYGGSQFDDPEDVEVVNNGYLVTGYSNSTDGDVTGNHGDFDYWTIKIDSVGNLLWQTSLGGEGIEPAFNISYVPNYGYLIAGNSNSTTGDVTGNHGDYDVWIVKLKDDATLPVRLLNFTAQRQNSEALLHWQTTNEINNNYFDIERSADSKLFSFIGNVKGFNGTVINNYSFTDDTPLRGKNYYRLKQVDKDGKYIYSNIILVDFTKATPVFSAFPNPANNIVTLNISANDKPFTILIFDVTGKKIKTEAITANQMSKQIDVSGIAAGAYTIVLIQNGKSKTIKLIKK